MGGALKYTIKKNLSVKSGAVTAWLLSVALSYLLYPCIFTLTLKAGVGEANPAHIRTKYLLFHRLQLSSFVLILVPVPCIAAGAYGHLMSI